MSEQNGAAKVKAEVAPNIRASAAPASLERHFLFYKGDISKNNMLRVLREISTISIGSACELDLVIISPGGDAHAAFQLVKILRERCQKLRTIVPLYAKSAATLLALGSDEIVMWAQSELGPLDTQIEHPDESRYISALDHVGSLEYSASVAMDLAFKIALKARTEAHLSRRDSVRMGLKFAQNYITPLISQLDPSSLTKSSRELKVVEEYGLKLLKDYMFKEVPNKEEVAQGVAYELVWNYKTHGFVIDADEGKRLNLNIVDVSKYSYSSLVWDFALMMIQQRDDYIKLVKPSELEGSKETVEEEND